jgi:DNA-binding NarL/FixJ family response regulator
MTSRLTFDTFHSKVDAALIIDDQEFPSKMIKQILKKINPSMVCIHVDNTEDGMEWLTNPKRRVLTTRMSAPGIPDTDIDQIVKIKAVFLDNQVFHTKGGPLVENEGLKFLQEYREHPHYDRSILIFSNSADSNPEKFEEQGFAAILNKKPTVDKLKNYEELSESEESECSGQLSGRSTRSEGYSSDNEILRKQIDTLTIE